MTIEEGYSIMNVLPQGDSRYWDRLIQDTDTECLQILVQGDQGYQHRVIKDTSTG